ncbi:MULTISPECIES: type II toxin-antitoxin system Phd/YefM family antitoxin [Caulobacter]|jgi:antitoxin (DNA-binding transcriptional repressor) of toxin-antitoxin stability system|uniref:Antitoxin n=1 Tax=Caulobacter vibrioides OR37 TaxID=1292034 RepID=R0E8T9_CAUVI|nr:MULTISPECIES: type II toxin-antitoxin system Phd/YefM family antitoxin [Caulobacter]ENZ81903.1 antitoxin of toxin-antitoxin stability system [Caulobacter vibrioides OR37]MBQ1559582.1 type II toxin-antitoxin system Phd/YefM family antitoxin [Caulobacter sp.]
MTVVTVHYAKTNLSRLLAEVEAGGEVIIARGDKPVARLVAEPPTHPETPRPKRVFGSMKGRIAMDDSFFDPLPEEELTLWEGGPDDQ